VYFLADLIGSVQSFVVKNLLSFNETTHFHARGFLAGTTLVLLSRKMFSFLCVSWHIRSGAYNHLWRKIPTTLINQFKLYALSIFLLRISLSCQENSLISCVNLLFWVCWHFQISSIIKSNCLFCCYLFHPGRS